MVSGELNDHIQSYLNYYSTIEGPPGFAVLINGPWGVGKTWFIKEKVIAQDRNSYLYISLYGVSSEEEFFERALVQLNPWLESAGVAMAGRLVKGLATAALSLSLGDEAKVSGRADAASGLAVEARRRRLDSAIDRRILILDDVERSSMAPRQLWGLINSFVEQRGARLVIVANDEELSDVAEFQRTKEKYIGMTLTIQPDIVGALDSFISSQSEAARALLISRKEKIVRSFQASGYQSLRILRYAIRDFARIHGALWDETKTNEEAIENLVRTAFPLAFEVHAGSLQNNQPLEMQPMRILAGIHDIDDDGERNIDALEKKYGSACPFTMTCPGLAWWSAFFFNGKLDPVALNQPLKSRYIDVEDPPDWKRLAMFHQLTNAEFEELLGRTWSDVIAGKYCEMGALLHVVGVQIWAVNNSFAEGTVEQVVEIAKRALDELDDATYLDLASRLARSERVLQAYDGIAYAGCDETGFVEILRYVEAAAMERLAARTKLEGSRLRDRLQESCAAFSTALGIGVESVDGCALDSLVLGRDILCELDPHEFAVQIEDFDPSEQNILELVLWERFHRRSSAREKKWLEAVLHELEDRPPRMQLYFLKQRLREILK